MGKFIYEGGIRNDFEDRLLAHLQVVVGNKLRRGEPFYFVWKDDLSTGGGRTSVWVHPRANLVFKFSGGRPPGPEPRVARSADVDRQLPHRPVRRAGTVGRRRLTRVVRLTHPVKALAQRRAAGEREGDERIHHD